MSSNRRANKTVVVTESPTTCQYFWKNTGGIPSGPGALVRCICNSAL